MRYLFLVLALSGCSAWHVTKPGEPCAFVHEGTRINGTVVDSVPYGVIDRVDGTVDTLWAEVCHG